MKLMRGPEDSINAGHSVSSSLLALDETESAFLIAAGPIMHQSRLDLELEYLSAER